MNYTFQSIESCNMCGASSENFKTLGKRMNRSQGKNPRKKVGITTTVQQCKSCDLIFSNPMPIPKDLQDHYGMPPENYWVENYFTVEPTYFSEVIQWVNSINPIEKGMKALDIGAGIGKCMIALENASFDVYGIEPSHPFYDRALSRMKIDPSKIENIQIEDAQFAQETFDFITFGAVLEHLYNPADSIEKAMKWLKPGGLIQIEVPSSYWLTHKLINRSYKLRGMDYVANLSPMHEPYHLYEFGLKTFEKNAARLNYSITSHKYMVCDTFLPKSLDFIIKPYMKSRNKGMQLAVLLQKNT